MVALIYALAHAQHAQPQPSPAPEVTVLAQGAGPQAAQDARATVHFSAKLADGTVLADTESRGMAFTFLMDQDTVEPFWSAAVRGMRAGGAKSVRVHASTVGLAVPGDPFVTITLRLVRLAPLGR